MLHSVNDTAPEVITYSDLCERLNHARKNRSHLQLLLQREISNLFEEYLDSLSSQAFDDNKRTRARLGLCREGKFCDAQISQLQLSDDDRLHFAVSTGVGVQENQPAVMQFTTPVEVSLHQDNLRFVIEDEEILVLAGGSLPKFAGVCDTIKRHVWLQCGQAKVK